MPHEDRGPISRIGLIWLISRTGLIELISPIRLMGLIGLISRIGLIGLIGLMEPCGALRSKAIGSWEASGHLGSQRLPEARRPPRSQFLGISRYFKVFLKYFKVFLRFLSIRSWNPWYFVGF